MALLLAASTALAAERVTERLDIAPVWAGHPVGFCLLTDGDDQFVAFYDADRQMTVAQRRIPETAWRFVRLPETVVWDSHNSVTMDIDDAGCLHLSGNMHGKPLVYFRTREPRTIESFERIANMIGENETKVTYPQFVHGPNNSLLFTYRDGRSGEGNQIYNVYDSKTRTWRRLLDKPLTDGEGLMNAYFDGPRLGPDGYYHLNWVWRDTSDCATNHDLSYARSKDLVHWETSAGAPVALPMTLHTSEIVDPSPAGGGLLNVGRRLGFDSKGNVVLSFYKYDEAGNTQAYNARKENGAWVTRKVSDWDYRWAFSGGGTIPVEITVGHVSFKEGEGLTQSFSHVKHGNGTWLLDEATLQPIRILPKEKKSGPDLGPVESAFPEMKARTSRDIGPARADGARYMLRWETLGPNRDKPRDPPLPEPSMLRVYRIEE
jgi:hypothetical protein